MTSPATMSLRQVSRRFGDTTAVDALSLDLRPGSMTALLGASGCGKSTTLSMMAGLLAPDAGEIRIDELDMLDVAAQRWPVALVFQKPLLFPHLNVAENVAFGLRMRRRPRGEIKSKVADMLDRVQLGGLARRRVGELSGGQEQRAALARALVLSPRILLLDEPFSQLDAGLRAEMRALLRQLHSESPVTTVFVTHDQSEAVEVADDIALMGDGTLIGHGPSHVFYTRPPSLAAARFFGVGNELPGYVTSGVYRSRACDLPVPVDLPDGPATLVVRPESIQLGAGETAPVAHATVVAARFAGTHLSVDLRLPGGQALTAYCPIDRPITVGSAVAVRVPSALCTVFSAARSTGAVNLATSTNGGSGAGRR